MPQRKLNIMIVAGEASGDSHGARLAGALRAGHPETEIIFFGAAGPNMRDAGVEAVVRSDELSVVGLPEIAKALPMFLKAFRELKKAADIRRPDAVILVDFPDFNLRLARSLKRRGLRVIYYISPQLWAWRAYRLKIVKKYVDLVISILPFEKQWYLDRGFDKVEYVGNPLTREVQPTLTKREFCEKHGIDALRPLIALLPGSRHKEIVRILPPMLESAAIIADIRPETQFIAAFAGEHQLAEFEKAANTAGKRFRDISVEIRSVSGETYDALYAADAAAVTSGTATLETGIIGTPMAIVYKTSALNHTLLRPLIDVEHFGLINLIGDERIAKEFIQNDLTPQKLADELLRLLETETNANLRNKLRSATEKLGHGGASMRAADAILRLIG